MSDFMSRLKFPILATPKIDGIRCLTTDPLPYPDWISTPCTRSLKLIPNKYVNDQIARLVPPHIDGELTCGDNFQAVTSGIMTHGGEPKFKYYVFDCCIDQQDVSKFGFVRVPYHERVERLKTLYLPEFCVKLLPVQLDSLADLERYEAECLAAGAEGVMVRPPWSPAYQGRSSFSRPYLVAIKRFTDSEARVELIHEKMHNGNPAETNLLGYKERTTHKAQMVGMNTMGSLECVDITSGQIFCVGTGFTDDQRDEIWRTWPAWQGRIIKYRYQSHGTLNAPRIPSFVGLRDERDMSPRTSGQSEMTLT